MKCKAFSFLPIELPTIKNKVLHYTYNSASTFSYLDNNKYNIPPHRYELLVGIGLKQRISFEALEEYQGQWIFGQLDYEFNPKIVDISTKSENYFLFIPKIVVAINYNRNELVIFIDDPVLDCDNVWEDIINTEITIQKNESTNEHSYEWQELISKDDYIATVEMIREDIYHGRYYELNYCIPYIIRNVAIDALAVFKRQQEINPSPFAAFIKYDDTLIISGSMERYIYQDHTKLIAQPIKGTIRRSQEDIRADEELKLELYHNEKERAENVMIVDLTRNDLAQVAEVGSVEVTELFGIYTFPFVHQMISTISAQLKRNKSITDILKIAYPMGSMTGAPKKTVMEHIKKYECTPRGIYSGTIIYINPEGNWDSSVVIRTLVFKESEKTLSYHTGSAITYDSNPATEWEELQVKAEAMRKVTSGV